MLIDLQILDEDWPILPLVENGADPNDSGFGLTRPLVFAVRCRQPLSLIERLVKVGAKVRTATICVAVRARNYDVT